MLIKFGFSFFRATLREVPARLRRARSSSLCRQLHVTLEDVISYPKLQGSSVCHRLLLGDVWEVNICGRRSSDRST